VRNFDGIVVFALGENDRSENSRISRQGDL